MSAVELRVLERCGFLREGALHRHSVIANLGIPEPQDVRCHAQIPGAQQAV
jgi:RimJ/RimL family protein N-acetyltransferase